MGKSVFNPDFTEKENAFVDNYLSNGFNQTQAALEAGYSPKTAASLGYKMIAKPKIKKEIAKRLKKLNKDKVVDQQDVLVHLFFAVTRTAEDFVDEDGILHNNIHNMNPRARACVDGIKQKVTILTDPETGEEIGKKIETDVKVTPKLQAIEIAMKHKGMFPPVGVKHSGEVNHKHSIDWDSALSHTERDEEDILDGMVIDDNLPQDAKYIENESEEETLYDKSGEE